MDTVSHIIARASRASKYCPAVGYCDPIYSIYGYRPSLPATVIFLALFAVSGVGHLVQGVKYKTKFFALAMAWGCILEIIGYISKVLLWKDPYSNIGFKMSLIMLTLAPAFFSAGIYYTLKHICLTFGAQYSRIKPALYTPVFISCDLLSIVLQAVGGGLAASAEDQKMMDAGDHIMVAGLTLQVFTLVVFGSLAADYGITVYKHRHHLNSSTREFRSSFKFRAFLAALTLAYLAILIRCAYRVAELAGGWSINNQILRNEGLFLGLDSTMCIIATLVLNIFHPGRCLPDTRRLANDTEKQQRLVSHSDVSVQMQGK